MKIEPNIEAPLSMGKSVARTPSVTEGEYWWISDSKILTLLPSSDPKLFVLGCIDIKTGQKTSLDAFNKKFSKMLVGQEMHVSTVGDPRVEIVYNPPNCDLSSDRKWLLWLSRDMTWIAATLDGKQQKKWHKQGILSSHGIWLRDSTRWVELVSYYQKKKYTIEKAVVRGIDSDEEKIFENLKVDDGLIVGVTSSNHILIRYGVKENALNEAAMVSLDLGSSIATKRQFSAQLLRASHISDVAISDAGDRLAWILELGNRRRFPKDYSFCISGVKGEEMREFGRIRGKSEPSGISRNGKVYYWPQSIRWTPDGKRVSFVFKEELYVINVF